MSQPASGYHRGMSRLRKMPTGFSAFGYLGPQRTWQLARSNKKQSRRDDVALPSGCLRALLRLTSKPIPLGFVVKNGSKMR
jgi:hypothetical protein